MHRCRSSRCISWVMFYVVRPCLYFPDAGSFVTMSHILRMQYNSSQNTTVSIHQLHLVDLNVLKGKIVTKRIPTLFSQLQNHLKTFPSVLLFVNFETARVPLEDTPSQWRHRAVKVPLPTPVEVFTHTHIHTHAHHRDFFWAALTVRQWNGLSESTCRPCCLTWVWVLSHTW